MATSAESHCDPALTVRDAAAAFHLLAGRWAVCNLDCAYCFFLSKEMLNPGSRFRMAEELLDMHSTHAESETNRAPALRP